MPIFRDLHYRFTHVQMLCYCALNYAACYRFLQWRTAPSGPGPPHQRGFSIPDTPHSVGLLCVSDQPVAETSTGQHTTLTRDRHPCHRRDSNPQPQQANGRTPTPQTAPSLRSVHYTLLCNYYTCAPRALSHINIANSYASEMIQSKRRSYPCACHEGMRERRYSSIHS
jgi:hypothetical protein